MNQRRSIGLVMALLVAVLLVGACVMRPDFDQDAHRELLVQPAPLPTIVAGNGALLRPAPLPTPSTVATEDLIKLSTEEQIALVVAPERDLRDLAMRLIPDVGEIPLVVNEETPEFEVGDLVEFWAHDMDIGRDFPVTAELVYKTDVAYAWVEEDENFDEETLIETIDRFSEQSYPALRAFFGSEWNPGVDNDPRLHILHATGLGNSIAGYYSSSDEYSILAQPTSNEKEMFYVELDWLNGLGSSSDDYDTVLAHEFQHMIHWYRDMNEDTWVNEGLSEFAQDVAGFGPTNTFSDDFLSLPDTQLDSWGASTEDSLPHYGAAYLFILYFAQRFGPEMTSALVAHPANGIDGINDILAMAETGLTFDDVYADWVIANYAEEPDALGLDGIYGYHDFDHRKPELEETYTSYPVDIVHSQVYNYGTDYLHLKGEADLTFHFKGAELTQLAPLPLASEHYSSWWSNRGDTSDTKLTRRFDLSGVEPGEKVEMHATMWWDIEQDYDFVYVVASRDGEKWTILEGQSSTPSDGLSSFGPGYTGTSDRWQTERFDLSEFAGDEVLVRFEYVTDDAINSRGLFLNGITIPAIEYISDFGAGDGWESEGWIYTDNSLKQDWIVQVMTFDDDTLVNVEQVAIDDKGNGSLPITGLGDGRTAVVAISGAAPVILEGAFYEYWIDEQ